MFNKRFARSASSARLQLYGVRQDGGRWRRHAWLVALSSLYVVVTECLAEPGNTQARQAARSAVALSLVRWGCRCDPAEWQWEHLEDALQAELNRAKVRHLGDAYMLAAIMAEKGAPEAQTRAWGRGTARWYFTHVRKEGDALRHDAAHFLPPASAMLFEPGSRGLGLRPAAALLEAGMVAVGHYCVQSEDGQPRWLASAEEAAALQGGYRRSKEADAQLEEVLLLLAEAAEPCEAERALSLAEQWQLSEAGAAEAAARVENLRSRAKARAEVVAEASAQQGAAEGLWSEATWARKLKAAFPKMEGTAASTVGTWNTGVTDTTALAAGPCLWEEGARGVRRTGGEAAWLRRLDVGDDGWLRGWEARAAAALQGLRVDSEGRVVHETSRSPLTLEEAAERGPAVEMVVRARAALGDGVKIVHGDVVKREGGTFVNPRAAEIGMERRCSGGRASELKRSTLWMAV